jgi:alpha-glucosidase (family GH31 glycosyl hydrolase)
VGWVGDNHRDFGGLEDALDHIFRSARAGYAMIGSDIGGYLDRHENNPAQRIPFDQDTLARWTAVGAMNPFMELHGRANLEPWNVPERPEETVELYRYWSTLHHEMVPFWYSVTREAHAGGRMPIVPIGDEPDWPGDYRFEILDAFLVAPILDGTGRRDVALPAGARWVDWWHQDAPALDGGQTLAAYDATDRRTIPLFLKEGAIVPLEVSGALTALGNAASAGHLTLLAFPGGVSRTFTLHETDGAPTTVQTEPGRVSLSRAPRPVLLRVRTEAKPASVALGAGALAEAIDASAFDASTQGWYYDDSRRTTIVKLLASTSAIEVRLE